MWLIPCCRQNRGRYARAIIRCRQGKFTELPGSRHLAAYAMRKQRLITFRDPPCASRKWRRGSGVSQRRLPQSGTIGVDELQFWFAIQLSE
jgi:hypothetical protein